MVRRGLEWRSCVIFGSGSGWWLLRGEETEGDIMKPEKTRGCLRDFCLGELLCDDQRLNVEERVGVCVRTRVFVRACVCV